MSTMTVAPISSAADAATMPSFAPKIDVLPSVGTSDETLTADAANQPSFIETVKKAFNDANTQMAGAESDQRDLMMGKTNDTGAVVSHVEEASLTLDMALAIRNKILTAYQTVSSMQF